MALPFWRAIPGEQAAAGLTVVASPVFLTWATQGNLLCQTVVELLALAIALSAGVVAWYSYSLARNNYVLFLGLAAPAVAILDLSHAFALQGTGILPVVISKASSQSWLASRYLQAAVLAFAPLLSADALKVKRLSAHSLAAGLFIVAIALLGCASAGCFPAAYTTRIGTDYYEFQGGYAAVAVFCLAIVHLWFRRRALGGALFRLSVSATICFMIGTFAAVFPMQQYASGFLGAEWILSGPAVYIFPLIGAGLILGATLSHGLSEPIHLLTRALHMVVSCRHALVHSRDESALLGTICDTMVSKGGYRLAWIGFLESEGHLGIRPVKFAGDECGYLDEVGFSKGEAGLVHAIRAGRPVFATAGDGIVWKEAALRRGFVASLALPLRAPDHPVFGVLALHSAKPNVFTESEFRLLSGVADDLGNGLHARRSTADRDLAELRAADSMARLGRSLRSTVHALAFAVEKRDPYTAGHQRRVADLATNIGRRLGLSEQRLESLTMGGLVHDIGKIYIPSDILNRPGRLDAREFEIIRAHPDVGYEILSGVEFPWPVAPMVVQHHERMDGSGYPRHLKGEEIVLEARIIAVADVVEAMASHRPYRASLGMEAALAELRKKAGEEFDPDVVAACEYLFSKEGYQLPGEPAR